MSKTLLEAVAEGIRQRDPKLTAFIDNERRDQVRKTQAMVNAPNLSQLLTPYSTRQG